MSAELPVVHPRLGCRGSEANGKESRKPLAASDEALLSGLEKLLDSSKDGDVLTRATTILEAAIQNKSFVSNVTCCLRWLSAAKTLVTKEEASADVLRSVVQCLHKMVPIPAGAASDWCQVGLLCLLRPEVRTEAHQLLCGQRKATLAPPRRGADAAVYAAIKDCIGPQLSRWMENGQGSAALQVWTLIIQWMGEYLPQNAASVNVLLRVASKGFASSSQPQLQCQALESWQVLISTFKPETLRMHKMLVLVMTPLRQRPSVDTLVRLALVRTLWHLAVTLGPQHLATCFQQVGVTLLKTLSVFLAETSTPAQSGCDHDNLRRECLYALLRLLQVPVDPIWQNAMECVPLACLASPLDTGVLGRHLEACDQTCRAAIAFIQQCCSYAPELGCLLMHLLLRRATEAHAVDNIPVVAALLKLVLDGLADWLPAAPLACKTVLWEASHLPEKMLTSHCYYSGKQGQLHGTPVLSILKLLLQPSLVVVFNSTEEVTQLFQRLLTLGLQNPSRLHLLQSVLSCLERCPPAAPLACTLWLALASAVLTCLQASNEVNQGNDLEPDFSALVATLAFPVHHGLPSADAKLRKAVTRRWLQLYRAFSCAAVLVPNVSPHSICHETWRRLCPALTEQLKQDMGYVDAVCDLLAAAGPSSQNSSASSGSSPGPSVLSVPARWGQRPHRGSALAELQPYCQALAWALGAISNARRSASGGKLVRPVQDLVGCLRGVPPLIEAVGLLAPAVSSLLASGQAPKVAEPVWVSLCGALVSQCQAAGLPDEQSLLDALAPMLEAALGRRTRGPVHDRTVHLWHTLFSQRPNLQVPPRLRDVLCKAKLLPDLESEGLAFSMAVSASQDSLVPDAQLPRTPPKRERVAPSTPSSTTRPTILRVRRASPRSSPRKRRSLYDFRAEEFVEVRESAEKKRVLTEHQREVLKERRSLPALYSNLSQSGLDSQDSEETPQSEDMDSAPPTNRAENPAVLRTPLIVLDSESDEDVNLQSSQHNGTLEPQDSLPPNTVNRVVVPETQQDSAPGQTPLDPAKAREPSKANPAVAGGSPRVHRPRARLSFARLPTPGKEDVPGSTEVVPSSQSTIDSSDDEVGSECQSLEGPEKRPATVWVQDKGSGRLVASQSYGSPETQTRECASLLQSGPDQWHGLFLEEGIAPLGNNEPEKPSLNGLSSKQSEEPLMVAPEECANDADVACSMKLPPIDTEAEEPLAGEQPANEEHSPSQEYASTPVSDVTVSQEYALHLSEASPSCFSASTECITQTPEELSEVMVCSEETEPVELASETEEDGAAVQGADSGREDDLGACMVQETEDNGSASTEELSRVPSSEESSPLRENAVRGARKRKLPSQTTSPIASRLRAKQLRQRASSPPGSGGSRPPRWAGSPASLSRSRIMLDAAMRSVGSSPPSRRSTSAPLAHLTADGPPTGILKQRVPPPQPGSPQQAKVPTGRRVSFADPPVQGEFEIASPPRKRACSRPLYEEASLLEEEELVDSQQPLWAALQGSKEAVEAILPLVTSSLWCRSLGRKLRLQGITTIGDLASLTAAQALQLPIRPPRVATLRRALEQHASLHCSPLQEDSVPAVESEAASPTTSADVASSSQEVVAGKASCVADSLETELEGAPCSQPPLLGNCQETAGLTQDCSAASPSLSASLGERASVPGIQVTSLGPPRGADEASSAEDILEVEAIPCTQAPRPKTCQDSPVEASPPSATDPSCHQATLEHSASVTDCAMQTDSVVLSSDEVFQLLTPEFFASLQLAQLGHIFTTAGAIVTQHSNTH